MSISQLKAFIIKNIQLHVICIGAQWCNNAINRDHWIIIRVSSPLHFSCVLYLGCAFKERQLRPWLRQRYVKLKNKLLPPSSFIGPQEFSNFFEERYYCACHIFNSIFTLQNNIITCRCLLHSNVSCSILFTNNF